MTVQANQVTRRRQQDNHDLMSSPPDEVGENQFTGRSNLSENGELRPTAKKKKVF